jgi:hypothetical protein
LSSGTNYHFLDRNLDTLKRGVINKRRSMNIQTWAWVFAVVLLAVGVLGFVPGITTGGYLLGIFAVDAVHNIVHLVTGLAALAAAMTSAANARLFFKVFGVVYAIVAVLGFLQGDMVLGLFVVNMADHVLHLVIAAVALYLGFMMKGGNGAMPQAGGGM